MSSLNNMPKTSSGKKPIDKIVVCGCSFSRPGQSGIDKIWSHYLEEALGVPVVNLTWESGGSNSEILRRLSEYVWTHPNDSAMVIAQWTTPDRIEFCHNNHTWYQIRQTDSQDGTDLPQEIELKIEKLKESQAYTYSDSTYFWNFIQILLAFDNIMKLNHCRYLQAYCVGSLIQDFIQGNKKLYFDPKTIYKIMNKTSWLFDDVLKADLNGMQFPTVSSEDPHFNDQGHQQLAKTFSTFIKHKGWL